jgi:hypothetical protein
MASFPKATQPQLEDREGLSPSPDEPSPGVVGIADRLDEDEDDDDIEFEPWDEQSSDSEGITEGVENDDDEYVGMFRITENSAMVWLILSRCTRRFEWN